MERLHLLPNPHGFIKEDAEHRSVAATELVKAEAFTSKKYGCEPEHRSIPELIERGVVVIDKPKGPTSHQVTLWVKDILGARKAAHVGTLDPKVTGVLPILLGKATKLSGLLAGEKEYVCLMRLHKKVEPSLIEKVCREFVGSIYQRPPLKSAVKRRIRVRKIYSLKILEVEGKEVLFKVRCEAGTYIRMLCHHIGLALGVGAHMFQLRRTRAGIFSEDDAVTLHDLKDAYVFYEEGDESFLRRILMPMERAAHELPYVVVKDTAVDAICHGADLAAPGIVRLDRRINAGDSIVVLTLKGEAVAVGEAKLDAIEMLRAEKGICVETKKVLMEPGTYPRCWGRAKPS